MNYVDLTIADLKKLPDYWYATLTSDTGIFNYPIASIDKTREQLEEEGIHVGTKLLGAIENNNLIAVSKVKESSRRK